MVGRSSRLGVSRVRNPPFASRKLEGKAVSNQKVPGVKNFTVGELLVLVFGFRSKKYTVCFAGRPKNCIAECWDRILESPKRVCLLCLRLGRFVLGMLQREAKRKPWPFFGRSPPQKKKRKKENHRFGRSLKEAHPCVVKGTPRYFQLLKIWLFLLVLKRHSPPLDIFVLFFPGVENANGSIGNRPSSEGVPLKYLSRDLNGGS